MTDPISLSDMRNSRLDLVTARRKELAQRNKEIKETLAALTKEQNDLYHEDQELEQAEKTIRKLLQRQEQK